MMQFPAFVYRCPGSHFGPAHTTYETLNVASQDALEAARADGWHFSLKDAADAYLSPTEPVDAPVVEVQPEPADNAPPTRAEMMQQAELLGLKVDRRWGDETLLAKINAAMAAKPAKPAADDPI